MDKSERNKIIENEKKQENLDNITYGYGFDFKIFFRSVIGSFIAMLIIFIMIFLFYIFR